MALKILCAGYGKDEKFEIEKMVRSVFAPPLDREAWSVSLVKLGSQVTVSVDGPDERIRNKSFMASTSSLPDQLRELLTSNGYDLPSPGGRAPAAPSAPGSSSGSWPSLVRPSVSAPATRTASAPTASSRPAPAPVAPRPSAPPPKAPAAPAPARGRGGSGSGRHARDPHQCPNCNASFVVTYELQPNEPRQLVAVACPHCWKLDRVEVGETAALERAYRADKA